MADHTPVPFFDLDRQFQTIESDVRAALDEVIASHRYILGSQVSALEEALKDHYGYRHAIACASGTDALLLPLRALDAQPGDEVIVPAFTFFATAGAVVNAGLRPVFCDVDPETFNVTREHVEAVWSERTRAVIAVHLFGQMAVMEELVALCGERGAVLIEDVAQSQGATRVIDGVERHAGTVGDVGTFSFFPTKNLGGMGDGGLVSTSDDEIAEAVSLLRVHGGRKMYHHSLVGTNSRLDTMQAAVLLAKLPHVDGWIERRRANAAAYRERLAGLDEVQLPVEAACNRHSYNQFTLRAERRDELREHLSEQGIGSGLYYPLSLHLQPCFADLGGQPGQLPVSEALTGDVVSLPIFPELTEDEIDRVCEAVRGFYGA